MIFIQNKYTRIYYSIINRAQSRILPKETYTEKHHIIPKSLGGSNAKDNLVVLTAREHFICHWLLTKMTESLAKSKMHLALMKMCVISKTHKRHKITSEQYTRIRIQAGIANSGLNSPMYRRKYSDAERLRCSLQNSGKNNPMYGRTHSANTRSKMSIAGKGRVCSDETRANMSSAHKGLLSGIPKSEAHIQNMRGYYWWTNGVDNVKGKECPDGWRRGRTTWVTGDI